MTIASPCEVTLATHGLATGDSLYLTTTDHLPTGLSINTQYWVIKENANTFWLATSLANALAGTKINTSVTQAGVHTATLCPYGVGNGTTTFNLPNIKGAAVVGKNQSDSEFAGLGQTGGEKTHVLLEAELAAHVHTVVGYSASGGSVQSLTQTAGSGTSNTSSVGSNTAHNNLQPYLALNYIVKT
jgi:microcystin-dependent protein